MGKILIVVCWHQNVFLSVFKTLQKWGQVSNPSLAFGERRISASNDFTIQGPHGGQSEVRAESGQCRFQWLRRRLR